MADVTETRAGPRSAERGRAWPGLVGLFSEGGPVRVPPPYAVRAPGVVGREPASEFYVDDSQISRQHARVEPASGGVRVTDLGSRNGTFVNGQRVPAAGTLAPTGAILRCGKTLLGVVDDVTRFVKAPSADPRLVGGPRMAELRRVIATVAVLPQSVLLLGETGTGKERVAEALHAASGRGGPFVAVNCNAIAGNLVESELFGHVRGAFSGSDRAREGLFRSAEGGTLFLDEIGDLPLPAQGKLLRALETGEVRAVGADRPDVVHVRVVAATNADLPAMVTAQRFRADLLHRISTWKIVLPPLRERREDVPLLVAHFREPGGPAFAVEAMERLLLWSWPGNVRELRSAVQTAQARAVAGGEARVEPSHLPPDIANAELADTDAGPDADALLRTRIETALALRSGNVAQVARDLGRGRQALYAEMQRLGIDPKAHRAK